MAAAPATTLPYSRKGETAPRALHSPLAVTIRYRIVHASRERWPVTRNPRAGIRESAWLRRHWTDVADAHAPWVAVLHDGVIARAPSFHELFQQLKQSNIYDALVACVRPEGHRAYRIA